MYSQRSRECCFMRKLDWDLFEDEAKCKKLSGMGVKTREQGRSVENSQSHVSGMVSGNSGAGFCQVSDKILFRNKNIDRKTQKWTVSPPPPKHRIIITQHKLFM